MNVGSAPAFSARRSARLGSFPKLKTDVFDLKVPFSALPGPADGRKTGGFAGYRDGIRTEPSESFGEYSQRPHSTGPKNAGREIGPARDVRGSGRRGEGELA